MSKPKVVFEEQAPMIAMPPPKAKQLYAEFEARLCQRMVSARTYLRFLFHIFRHQNKQGLAWSELPKAWLEDYLFALTPKNRQQAGLALQAWLRFLYIRKQLLLPLHEQLPCVRYPIKRSPLLSHDQVLALLQLPSLVEPEGLRDRAFLETAYATGMRKSELILSDHLPTYTDMTVPASWKGRRLQLPAGLKLHCQDLQPSDKIQHGCFQLTDVARTLIDCAQVGLSPEWLEQARNQARRRGLLPAELLNR